MLLLRNIEHRSKTLDSRRTWILFIGKVFGVYRGIVDSCRFARWSPHLTSRKTFSLH